MRERDPPFVEKGTRVVLPLVQMSVHILRPRFGGVQERGLLQAMGILESAQTARRLLFNGEPTG